VQTTIQIKQTRVLCLIKIIRCQQQKYGYTAIATFEYLAKYGKKVVDISGFIRFMTGN
jgi:hypothetical protein